MPSENSIEIESSQHARILAANIINDQHHTITLNDNGSKQNKGFMLCHTNDDALKVGMTYAICHHRQGPMLYFNIKTNIPHFKGDINSAEEVPLLFHVVSVSDSGNSGVAHIRSLTRGYLNMAHASFSLNKTKAYEFEWKIQ